MDTAVVDDGKRGARKVVGSIGKIFHRGVAGVGRGGGVGLGSTSICAHVPESIYKATMYCCG